MKDRGEDSLLPKEVYWLCLFIPPIIAPLLIDDLFEMPLDEALKGFAAMYIPSTTYPLGMAVLYGWIMPRLLPRLSSGAARIAAHAILVTGVALIVGRLNHPLHYAFLGEQIPLRDWLVKGVVINWLFTAPALIVQHLRLKAQNVERRSLAERQTLLEAQLQALQARTNPHFFFNSINTVASLIPEDPVLAERTLERVAEILRYALEASKRRFVPLRREVEVVKDYLAVQAARFGDRLRWRVDLDEAAAGVEVPPLILQPLVENAILHGIGDRRAGGEIIVTITRDGGQVVIAVSDDGPGPGKSAHHGSGTSMSDLKERLRLVYGDLGRLETGAVATGGFWARVAIPEQVPA